MLACVSRGGELDGEQKVGGDVDSEDDDDSDEDEDEEGGEEELKKVPWKTIEGNFMKAITA